MFSFGKLISIAERETIMSDKKKEIIIVDSYILTDDEILIRRQNELMLQQAISDNENRAILAKEARPWFRYCKKEK